MAYEKLNWQNGKQPALNAANLNHMEDGIVGAFAAVEAVNQKVEAMADPMGPWKYAGKLTEIYDNQNWLTIAEGEQAQKFFTELNQIMIKINNLELGNSQSVYQFYLQFRFTKSNGTKDTFTFQIITKGNGSLRSATFSGGIITYNLIGYSTSFRYYAGGVLSDNLVITNVPMPYTNPDEQIIKLEMSSSGSLINKVDLDVWHR